MSLIPSWVRKICLLDLRDEIAEARELHDTGSRRLRATQDAVLERTQLSPQARALLDLAGTLPRREDQTVRREDAS